jgi:hypothetical protein
MKWPMEVVKLSDCADALVDEWTGFLAPPYLAGLPNENAAACYTLEYECGVRWAVGVGDLGARVWDALIVHESWCKS